MNSRYHEQFTNNLKNHPKLLPQTMKWHKVLHIAIIFLCMPFNSLIVMAQPSGGPYGPIRHNYDLPKGTGKVFYVAPDAKAEESGETLAQPTTIESAIEQVQTGDVIVMRGGTYRTGNLILNQGITLQPYADEQPVLKGTFIATEWKNLGNGLWKTSWSHLFPAKPDNWWSRDKFGKETPLCRFNNDMVFVDGKFLQAVSREGEVDENSYYIDYDGGYVYIGTDPTMQLVEITAFDVAIKRTTGKCHGKTSDHKGPVIKGITFTQYAYRAIEIEGTEPVCVSNESDHGKEVVGTTLEHCTISFCSRVAGYFRGDKLTLRYCKVSDTSTEGIYIIGSSDVLLEKNIFTRNNIERIAGYYPAAVKIFNQCYRVTCQDNLVIDLPNSNGIWYDVGNVDGHFLNNWIEGVGNVDREFLNKRPYPSDNGFFFEISKGAVCAGNVFVNCDQGIFILNSSNVQIYQNTFVNSTVCIGRNGRSPANDGTFGWHSGTGPDVHKRGGHVFVNNLLTGDKNYHRPLMLVSQPDSLSKLFDEVQLKQFDYNTFVQHSDKDTRPFLLWTPAIDKDCQIAFKSPKDLQKMYPEFLAHSQYISDDIPLFKSRELGNYQLLHTFPGNKIASPLPVEIKRLLGISQKDIMFIGAFPPLP